LLVVFARAQHESQYSVMGLFFITDGSGGTQ